MIIIFLQLRNPPVLPALHQRQEKRPSASGKNTPFADDLDRLRNFGRKNKESLGQLLFQFFRFYAHEFNYGKYVLSVRLGKMVPKTEKNWQNALNNMLCVEEPFNTARNLGNTADDTSFRGLHMELRRAFELISEAKLKECCETYQFPPEEEKIFQKPPQASRPVILRSSSQQHGGRGRGGFRGNRQRNSNNSRRASAGVAYENNPMYIQAHIQQSVSPQEMQWYAQQPLQYPYQHPDLVSTAMDALRLGDLRLQEQQLRLQLYSQQQAMAQQAFGALAQGQRSHGSHPQSADRSRTNSLDNPPLSAPLRQDMFMYHVPTMPAGYWPQTQAGFTTLPNSPATTSSGMEFRRSLHRSGVNAESANSGVRSQSQPASRTPMPGVPPPAAYMGAEQYVAMTPQTRQVNGVVIPSFMPDENLDMDFDDAQTQAMAYTPPDDDGVRYPGYFASGGSSPARQGVAGLNGIPAFGDLGHAVTGGRRLSTDQQEIIDRRLRRASRSRSRSPLGHARAFSVGNSTAPLPSAPFPTTRSPLVQESRPLVVNGSAFKPGAATPSNRQPSASESTASEESAYENPLRFNAGLGINTHPAEAITIPAAEGSPAVMERPLVVNGSTQSTGVAPKASGAQSFNDRVAALGPLSQASSYAGVVGGTPNGASRHRMMSRQQHNVIAPLDLAIADHSLIPEAQHLSPVFEARTPSPSVMRKESFLGSSQNSSKKEAAPVPSQKPLTESSRGKHETPTSAPMQHPKVNGLAGRENGHARGKSESDNSGWQKPKSRKKAIADLRIAANGASQAEQLPRNEEDRKGG
jgi:hypothetical protein